MQTVTLKLCFRMNKNIEGQTHIIKVHVQFANSYLHQQIIYNWDLTFDQIDYTTISNWFH